MIIGNGDIAKALKPIDEENILFFASGVSNSREDREEEYEREKKLLMKQDKLKPIVYFSSLCIFYSDSRYARHKMQMETLVNTFFLRHVIVRLGNITWGKNPHTLINYLKLHKDSRVIQNVYRYVIDKGEFMHWMKMIPSWSCEMNITGERLKVIDIVKKYVND